jgi:MarR family transcriptional regulator, organic hydroperoxide resistance regulator
MEAIKNPEEIKPGMLLANIGRLHSKRADKYMDRFGLYRGQAILLKILKEKDGLTHSEIAEKLEISPAAATKVIKRMETLNYVRRQSDPADERVSRVFIQEEGTAVVQQIESAFEQMDKVLLSNLDPEEQRMLVKLLWKVYASLLEHEND